MTRIMASYGDWPRDDLGNELRESDTDSVKVQQFLEALQRLEKRGVADLYNSLELCGPDEVIDSSSSE